MSATRARAYRLISQGFGLLAEAEDPSVQEVPEPDDGFHNEWDRTLWSQGRILQALEEHGGAVSKEQFYAFGARETYKPQGMGGFSNSSYRMVECDGDRRILTEKGRERLNEARKRWPEYFGQLRD